MLEQYNTYLEVISKVNNHKPNTKLNCIIDNVGVNEILSKYVTHTSQFFSSARLRSPVKCMVGELVVNQENLNQLLEISNKSSFGKGSETIFDETIRKAKEIAGDKLNVTGINFNEIERALMYNFDIQHQLIFELHKLNIYEVGSFFESHVDTLYDKNHIATLLIGLDFKYEGGELQVKCGDYAQTNHATKPNEWCCFFTDCEHKVQPITSGTRVTLQYNIYLDPTKLSHLAKSKYETNPRFIENYNLYGEQRLVINPDVFLELEQYLLGNLSGKTIGLVLRHKYHRLTTPVMLKGFDKQLWNFLESTQNFNLQLDVAIINSSAEYDDDKKNGDYKYTLTCELLGNADVTADIYITHSVNYITIKDEQYHGNEHCEGDNVYSNIVISISNK